MLTAFFKYIYWPVAQLLADFKRNIYNAKEAAAIKCSRTPYLHNTASEWLGLTRKRA